MSRPHLLLTGGLLVVLIGLGATDALLVEPSPLTASGPVTLPSVASTSSFSSSSSAALSSQTSITSQPSQTSSTSPTFPTSSLAPIPVTPPPVPPPSSAPLPQGGVRKDAGKDVLQVVSALTFTAEETQERSLLSAVVQNTDDVETRVLLLDGDRAGLLAWVETPNVKQVFLVLKESLHSLFSPAVKDLLDEIQTPEGRPPRNFLTFLDTGISEERLVFVRVRERLFEFHIAPGKEDAMYKLVEALTK